MATILSPPCDSDEPEMVAVVLHQIKLLMGHHGIFQVNIQIIWGSRYFQKIVVVVASHFSTLSYQFWSVLLAETSLNPLHRSHLCHHVSLSSLKDPVIYIASGISFYLS